MLSLQLCFIYSDAQNLSWAKQISGHGTEYAYSIATDDQGNVYTTGKIGIEATDFDPDSGVFNMSCQGGWAVFVSKLDAAGHFVWAKQICGGGIGNYGIGYGITVDAFANVYVIGRFEGTADFDPDTGVYNLTAAHAYDVFILKLDSAGKFIWARSLGGIGYEYGYSIAVDKYQNVYSTGTFEQTADFDPGSGVYNLSVTAGSYVFVSKLDSLGDFVWAKLVGGSNSGTGTSIALDDSGNVFATGYFSGIVDFDPGTDTLNLISSGIDAYVIKLSGEGILEWVRQFGGSSADKGVSIAVDNEGSVYATGTFMDTADFDPGVVEYNLVSFGDKDVFVSRLDSSGNFMWARQLGGSDVNLSYSLAIDSASNVYTIGYFEGTIDLDPGIGTSIFNSPDIANIFISRLNKSGIFISALQFTSNSHCYPGSIIIDLNGNVCSSGCFSGITDFDPSLSVFNMIPVAYDIYVVKLGLSTGVDDQLWQQNELSIYPVPASSYLTITFPDFISERYLDNEPVFEIYSIIGKKIYCMPVNSNQITINCRDFAEGIYFVNIGAGDKYYSRKFIIQH